MDLPSWSRLDDKDISNESYTAFNEQVMVMGMGRIKFRSIDGRTVERNPIEEYIEFYNGLEITTHRQWQRINIIETVNALKNREWSFLTVAFPVLL